MAVSIPPSSAPTLHTTGFVINRVDSLPRTLAEQGHRRLGYCEWRDYTRRLRMASRLVLALVCGVLSWPGEHADRISTSERIQ